jgi:3-hydroxyisobutyrate dehydrogenase-like beta-hydroxyacid dehydrogenase
LGESDAVSFTVSGIVKDLTLFNETAGQFDVPTPCMRAALASFKSHKDTGNGQEDFASMLRAAYESA